jgi:hypothetical protein
MELRPYYPDPEIQSNSGIGEIDPGIIILMNKRQTTLNSAQVVQIANRV